jgi:hypothetical protein
MKLARPLLLYSFGSLALLLLAPMGHAFKERPLAAPVPTCDGEQPLTTRTNFPGNRFDPSVYGGNIAYSYVDFVSSTSRLAVYWAGPDGIPETGDAGEGEYFPPVVPVAVLNNLGQGSYDLPDIWGRYVVFSKLFFTLFPPSTTGTIYLYDLGSDLRPATADDAFYTVASSNRFWIYAARINGNLVSWQENVFPAATQNLLYCDISLPPNTAGTCRSLNRHATLVSPGTVAGDGVRFGVDTQLAPGTRRFFAEVTKATGVRRVDYLDLPSAAPRWLPMWDDPLTSFEIDDSGVVGILSIGRKFRNPPSPADGVVGGLLHLHRWNVATGVSAPTLQRIAPNFTGTSKWWGIWTRGGQAELGNILAQTPNTQWTWNNVALPDVDGSLVVMRHNTGAILFDQCR